MDNVVYVHDSSYANHIIGQEGSKIFQQCHVTDSHIGKNSTIGDFSRLNNCTIGDQVAIQRNAMMYDVAVGDYSYTGKNFTAWHCSIGSFCSISWNVSIGGANHDYSRVTTHSFLYAENFGLMPEGASAGYDRFDKPCVIQNDVWIAANACVCRGVNVGTGAVIAAGAVVTRDVEPYTIVAGVPARPIKKRFDDETIQLLLESRWWEFPPEIIKENFELFNRVADLQTAKQLVEIRHTIEKG